MHLLLHNIFDDSVENWLDLHEQWSNVAQSLGVVNNYINLRVVFDDEMVAEFKTGCDKSFKLWVKLNGHQGMSNYLHIIGAHLPELADV